MNEKPIWPDLPLAAWSETCDTLQLWTQIVGKVRIALTPLKDSGRDMRFWLALVSMLLSLATANAQCVHVPAADGRPAFSLCPDTSRPPECDDRGCYFDELNRWRTPLTEEEFQRRAEEGRKNFEAYREKSN